jgi:hypothetical protein
LIVGCPSGVSRATSAGSSGYPLAPLCPSDRNSRRRPQPKLSARQQHELVRMGGTGNDEMGLSASRVPRHFFVIP